MGVIQRQRSGWTDANADLNLRCVKSKFVSAHLLSAQNQQNCESASACEVVVKGDASRNHDR